MMTMTSMITAILQTNVTVAIVLLHVNKGSAFFNVPKCRSSYSGL